MIFPGAIMNFDIKKKRQTRPMMVARSRIDNIMLVRIQAHVDLNPLFRNENILRNANIERNDIIPEIADIGFIED